MVRRLGIVVLLATFVLSGCGGGSDGDDGGGDAAGSVQACAKVYADGVVFKSKDELEAAFCDRDGENYLPGSAFEECGDGRTLFWNDEGWGYLGEPFHRHAPGAEQVAPQADRDACG